MDNVIIYNPDGSVLLDIPVDDSSYRFKKVMEKDELQLNFALDEYLEIPLRSYCIFKQEMYKLYNPENYKKVNTRNHEYRLILEGYMASLGYSKYKFFTVNRTGGTVVMESAAKLKFSVTLSPRDFIQLMVDNMNFDDPEGGWQVGEVIDSDPVTIDFNKEFCLSVLKKIADTFSTEFEIVGKTIHLRKVERYDNNGNRITVPLSYGYEKGILGGIIRTQYDGSKVINRLWIQGGDRNIDRKTYGNDTLLLPKNKAITYEGIEYKTDPTGSYIERLVRTGAISEDSLDVSKIYPSRVGTVSEVIVVDDEKGQYDIVDEEIPDDLDFSKMLVEGEKATVIFQNSRYLTGKEFDIETDNAGNLTGYSHEDRRFQLVPITDNGIVYPQAPLVPMVGDTYAVFHIRLPQRYIDIAENKALDESVKYLWENEQPKFTYRWDLDQLYAKRNWGVIGGMLNVGYFIDFSDTQFLPDAVPIRIVSVKDYINKPRSVTIEISNSVTGMTKGDIINTLPDKEQAIDRSKQETITYGKRSWRGAMELIENIYDPSGTFQNQLFSSVVIQAMNLLIGDPLLQFMFMNASWGQEVTPAVRWDKQTKQISIPVSYVRHMTLGIEDIRPEHDEKEYMHWIAGQYISDVIKDRDKFYYLYLRCSKDMQENEDGLKIGSASFFISDKKIDFDAYPDEYVLWVAFINSEEAGDRTITYVYGFSELTPGMLRVNRLVSLSGNNFFDLLTGALRAGRFDDQGNMISGFDVDPNRDPVVKILGGFSQNPNGDISPITVYRGEWSQYENYYIGDIVYHNGSSYLCKTDNYNVEPPDPLYWDIYASKGEDGKALYTWIRYADDASGGGISSSPIGKKYLGIAYNKDVLQPSNNPDDYQWSLIEGEGIPGEDGESLYTWVKFSDNPNGIPMYDSPIETTRFIGLAYNKTTPVESDDPADYEWTPTGQDGKDGTDYEWIFKLTATGIKPDIPPSEQQDKFVPDGWTDDATGVSSDMPFEWACKRTKTEGIWSEFSEPALWAHYSKDGEDGEQGPMPRVSEWKSDVQYEGSNSIMDVVFVYNSEGKAIYYKAKKDVGQIPVGTPVTNTDYWELMNWMENIATGLLIAEMAVIAGFQFFNNRIQSPPDQYGNYMMLDPNTRRISFYNSQNQLMAAYGLRLVTENGVVKYIKPFLDLSYYDMNGGVISSLDLGGDSISIYDSNNQMSITPSSIDLLPLSSIAYRFRLYVQNNVLNLNMLGILKSSGTPPTGVYPVGTVYYDTLNRKFDMVN